jgi:hypothetical protein
MPATLLLVLLVVLVLVLVVLVLALALHPPPLHVADQLHRLSQA